MEQVSFDIPQDRKRLNVGGLCLLLGLTVLLYIMIAYHFGEAARALAIQSQG